jgi:hypothetical protein
MLLTPILEHGLLIGAPTEGYVRIPGLHMSTIYNDLYKDIDPKRFNKEGGPDEIAMEYGSSFEEALEDLIAANLARRMTGTSERPGEFACMPSGVIVPVGTPGSIIFSPDHFFYEAIETVLGEFKSTRMTIGGGLRQKKFDKWFCQMMAYGFPLQMECCRLVALFINGHGKWEDIEVPGFGILPSGPLLLAWDIRFTRLELENNWRMLMRHATRKGLL